MLKLQILMNNYSAVSLLCDMISRCGLPIDIVGAEYNGALGLEQLKLYKPQIIILDRSLPVIGVERYLTLIGEIYNHSNEFVVLLVEPDARCLPMQYRYVFNTVCFNDISQEYLKSTFSDILGILQRQSAPSPSKDDADYKLSAQLLGDGSFSPAALDYLRGKYGFHSESKISLLLPRPFRPFLQFDTSFKKSLLWQIEDILKQYGRGAAFFINDGPLCIMLDHAEQIDQASREKLLFEIKYLLEGKSNVSFTFFLSNPSAPNVLGSKYRQIMKQYRYGYFVGNLDLITEADLVVKCSDSISSTDGLLAEQFHAIRILRLFPADVDSAAQLLNELYIWNLKPSRSFSELFYIRHKLELISSTILFLYHLEEVEGSSPFILDFETIEDECSAIKSWFYALGEKCSGYHHTVNELILKASAEIIDNFLSSVSLTQIASGVHVTDTYLSHLFKKETGTTFTGYLTLLKICSAKSYIRNTEKKVADVASALGFSDYRYFSQIFKKIVGMTPTEYKGYCHSIK